MEGHGGVQSGFTPVGLCRISAMCPPSTVTVTRVSSSSICHARRLRYWISPMQFSEVTIISLRRRCATQSGRLSGYLRYALQPRQISLAEDRWRALQVQRKRKRQGLAVGQTSGLRGNALARYPLQRVDAARFLESIGITEKAECRPKAVVADKAEFRTTEAGAQPRGLRARPRPGEVV